jgi:hypothetical protein
MSIDPKKIKVVYADPPQPVHFGTRELNVLTQSIMDLAPRQSLLIPTGGGNDHKIEQRDVNTRIKFIKRTHPDRNYVTRTLKPGDTLSTFTASGAKSRDPEAVQEITLAIFRTK